jgi:hypothetical protein
VRRIEHYIISKEFERYIEYYFEKFSVLNLTCSCLTLKKL